MLSQGVVFVQYLGFVILTAREIVAPNDNITPLGFVLNEFLDFYPYLEKVYPSAPKIFEMSGLSKPPTRLTVYSLSPKSWFSGKMA